MLVDSRGGTNPLNLGSAESESFAILSEIRANRIRVRICNLKKRSAVLKKMICANDLVVY
jgi:hypothetical protein